MTVSIIGDFNPDQLYCAGSFTKLLTTYVCLTKFSAHYELKHIIDDDNFLDSVCVSPSAKSFLNLFQTIIGSKFTLHDLCSFYCGLPYTFDLSKTELEKVDAGEAFKHHSIYDETAFLELCRANITPVFADRCKFHYSEIAIIFLGYLIEKIYAIKIEELFQKYLIDKFKLTQSQFSRTRPKEVYIQDLSPEYDYPSIAILDHGYFCYSNGFYTTLNDTKSLIENLLHEPIFMLMVDIKYARAASGRLLNGLTVEMRMVGDDLIYGYEGLSFSGCNLWAYSTKHQEGYVTFNNSEEKIYDIVYGKFGYTTFDQVPDYTEEIYFDFLKHYQSKLIAKDVPLEFQGNYKRVMINTMVLDTLFVVGKTFMDIRDPKPVRYDIVFDGEYYRIKGKDNIPDERVGFYTAKSGNRYMFYDGTLYRKIMSSLRASFPA